jgi:hypothetical protein
MPATIIERIELFDSLMARIRCYPLDSGADLLCPARLGSFVPKGDIMLASFDHRVGKG